MLRTSKAYSPAGISSIFEIMDRNANGTLISNPLKIGARGGGFVITRGVETEVRIEKNVKPSLAVHINRKLCREALTTEMVVHMLLKKVGIRAKVSIYHSVDPPIGCGYGTSAAGSLSAAVALCEVLNPDMTYNQIGQLAHVAEVKCRTGLGTVGPLLLGGHVITLQSGAPGFNMIDRIPIDQDCRIVTGWFGPISTRTVLSNQKLRSRINRRARHSIEAIMKKPNPESFMTECRRFAESVGFMTERLRRLSFAMEQSGAIGVTQNMLGEAVHALVEERKEREVCEAARNFLPRTQVFSTTIEFQGARPL